MIKKKKITVLKSYSLVLLFLFTSLSVSAQRSSMEYNVSLGAGFETFAYRPVAAKSSAGYGGDIGIGFTGFFTPNWGLYVGACFHMNNLQAKIDSVLYISPLKLDENYMSYELHSKLIGYKETQQTLGVIVPVMFQYQTGKDNRFHWKQSRKVNYYLNFGGKLHFLFGSRYNNVVNTLKNLAYYPIYDNWLGTQGFVGLGTFDLSNKSVSQGKLDFGFMASASIESGVKWRIDRRVFLYTGFFFDCGLNDPFKNKREEQSKLTYEEQLRNMPLIKFADGMYLLAVGIKMRVGFWRPL